VEKKIEGKLPQPHHSEFGRGFVAPSSFSCYSLTMEPSNNLDTAKLKKAVEDILAGGEKAVEEFDYSLYTIEELEYIMKEMDEQALEAFDRLIEMAEEYDKKQEETGNGTIE
jgi:hypothetical protein